MFPRRYFPGSYFAPRFWPQSQALTPAADPIVFLTMRGSPSAPLTMRGAASPALTMRGAP